MKSNDRVIKVFISYSRTNESKVSRLNKILRETGFTTWMDIQDLEGGQRFEEVIMQEIQECSVFLIIVSSQSMLSKPVAYEFFFAEELGKEIIPILIEESTDVPIEVGKYQWEQFDGKDRRQTIKVIKAIRRQYGVTVMANRNRANYREPSFAWGTRSFGPLGKAATQPLNETIVDIDKAYQEGNIANAEGNLERAVELWKYVLSVQPSYRRGELRAMVRTAQRRLYPRLDDDIKQRRAEILLAEQRQEETLGQWEALRNSIKKHEQVGYTNAEALNFVLYKCMSRAAHIGNWAKALQYLKDRERAPGFTSQQRRKAKLQRRALEKNRDAASLSLYDQARQRAQAGQDDATKTKGALKKVYAMAPAYGDPDGLVAQLAREQVATHDAERERILHEREQILADKKRIAEERKNKANERKRKHPLLGRLNNLAAAIGNTFDEEKQPPLVPLPLSQEVAEKRILEEVSPPPTRQFQRSAIPGAILMSLWNGVRAILIVIFAPFWLSYLFWDDSDDVGGAVFF